MRQLLRDARGAYAHFRALRRPSTERLPAEIRQPEWAWVPSPVFTDLLATYVYREWISTAIDRVAELCVLVPLEVRSRDLMRVHDHPLLELLGPYGRPNLMQDSMEFLESHFQRVDVYGNDIWYWRSSNGGPPDSVYQLDLSRVDIRADASGKVGYWYNVGGKPELLDTNALTHFRRANIVESGLFWGTSALQKLSNVVESDSSMTRWNQEFFGTGAPSGILIVDQNAVSAPEAKRIEREFMMSAKDKRRMVVIRTQPGNAVWNDASLKQRELEFKEGRMLTRQAAFDALGFHVGAVSEASTEAHARVSERFVRVSAYIRHLRMASRLNEALSFWPDASNYRIVWQDVRTVDWDMESKKLAAVQPYMTVDEVRSNYLDLPALGSAQVKIVDDVDFQAERREAEA